jgi:uroporphyrinogen-III synthase
MRILVTRPREDAEDTAARLRALGHRVLIAPLLEVRFRDGPDVALEGVQAILATSSNGVHALARRTRERSVPLYAVGAQTARTARDAGFAIVMDAGGDGNALAAGATRWAKPGAGPLLHAAGAQVQDGLAATLTRQGFDVRTLVLYEAVAAETLPPNVADALENGELDATMHFSPRSARIFSACVARAGLSARCAALTAYCISRATADALAPLTFRAVHVAARPDQDALLALLD